MTTIASVSEISLSLTPNEQKIFDFLNRSVGHWRTTREVCEGTIGWPSTSLKTHISHMRQKLQGTGWDIASRKDRGYRLVPPAPH